MDETLHYMAGFFDGEGCIGIDPPRGTSLYVLRVGIVNTRPEPLRLFRSRYNGKLLGPMKRSGNAKPVYQWSLEAKKAEAVVAELGPLLIIKGEQAKLALEFRQLFRGENILPRGNAKPNEEKRQRILQARRKCYEKMRKLNHRGL